MPHPARPSIRVKASKGTRGNIPDFSPKPKPKPKLKGKPQPTSAKSNRRGKQA